MAPLIFFLFATFLLIQTLIVGNFQSSSGVNQAIDSLNNMEGTFNNLNNYGSTLNSQGNIVVNDFNSANIPSCNTQSLISQMNQTYFPYVASYINDISQIPFDCSSGADTLHAYGSTVRNELMWLFYSFLMISVIVFAISLRMKNILFTKISIFSAELLLVAGMAVGAVTLMGLVFWNKYFDVVIIGI